MASKKIFTSLAFQSGAKLVAPKVEAITPEANLTTPTNNNSYYTGSAGQLAYNGGNIWVNNDSIWTKLLNHKTTATISGGFTFDRVDGNDAGIAPFIIGSSSQHKFVAGLQAETLGTNSATLADGTHGISDTATEHGIPVYGTGGVLKVNDPLTGDDAANRRYVDSAVQGLDHKESVRLATTGELGGSLSGTTFTGSGGGLVSIDGVALVADNRLLVKNQSNTAHNGIYTVTNPGAQNVPFVLERATDASEGPNLLGDDGNFDNDSDLDAWNHNGVGTQTRDSSNNYLKLTNASSGANPRARTNSIAFATEIGKTYKFTFVNINNGTDAVSGFGHLGTSAGASDIMANVSHSNGHTWQATSEVVYIQLGVNSTTVNKHTSFDDVSIVQVELTDGAFVFVEEGDDLASSSWVLNGTAWTQFSAAGQIEVKSNSATAAPLTKVNGNTINFAYNTTRFTLTSNALDIATNGIQSDQLGTNSVQPAQLQDTGSFKMAKLGLGGSPTAAQLGSSSWPTNALDVNGAIRLLGGGYATYAAKLTARLDSEHCLTLESQINDTTPFEVIGTYAGSGGASPRVVLSANGKPVGINVTDPSGTLHVQTARYGSNIFEAANTSWGTDVSNATAFDSAYIWNAYQTASIEVDNNELTMTTSATGRGIYTTGLALTAGKTYVIKLATGAISGATYKVFVRDTNGSYVSIGTIVASTTNTFTFTAQAGSYTGALYIYQDGSGSGSIVLNASSVTNELKEDTLTTAGTLSVNAAADDLVIANNANAGMTIMTPADGTGGIYFADKNHAQAGGIYYTHGTTNSLTFTSGGYNAAALTLDSNKNAKFEGGLGVGTAETAAGTITVKANGGRINVRSNDNLVGLLGNWGNSNSEDQNEGYLALYGAGVETIRIAANYTSYFNGGNVAIGKTSAGAQLEVHSAASHSAIHITSAGTNKNVDLKLAPTGTGSAFIAYGGSAGNNLDFFSYKTGVQSVLVLDGEGTQDHKANSIVNSSTVAGLQDGGACYDFNDTDSFIELASSGVGIFDKQAFTISTWVKLSSSRANDSIIFSYDQTSHATPYYASHIRVGNDGRVYFFWNNGTAYQDVSTSAGAMADDTWHHIVVAYKSGSQKIYVDGVQQASSTNTDTITYYAQEVWIGKGNYSAGNLDGSVRDFKYIPSWLDAPDIRKLYSGENPKKNLNVDLVTNGDFTANNDGWNNDQTEWSNTAGPDGVAGNLLVTTTSSGSWGYIGHSETILTVGKLYRLSFWFKKGTGTEGGIFLAGTSNLGGQYAYFQTGQADGSLGTSTSWTKFEKVFKATSTTIHLNPASSSGAVPNSAYFDDIRVEEVGTLVDFTPQSASSSKWRNEALLGFYDGTVNNATLSQGNTYWNNIKQDGDGVEFKDNIGIGTAPTTWKATISDGTTTGFINAYNNALSFGTNTDHPLKLYQNGTVAFQLDADGNAKVESKLGIGTSATFTDSQVAVVGDDNVGIALQSTHSGKTSRIRFFDNSGNQDATVGFANDTSNLFMGTGTNTHLVINQSGQVGIGTESAANLLHLSGADESMLMLQANTGSTGDKCHIGFGCSTVMLSGTNIGARLTFERRGASTGGDLAFHTRPVSGTLTERFVLRDDGTHDHKGNRIVNSQTVNDSWRTSEPSLRFDGSGDRVAITETLVSSRLTYDITVSCWYKPTADNYGTFKRIWALGSSSNRAFQIYQYGNNTDVALNGTDAVAEMATTKFTIGKWYHLVATYDGATVKTYVNGVAGGTAAGDEILNTSYDVFTIGGEQGNDAYTVDAEIRDVRIHNRAMDANEIKGLYNGESTPHIYENALQTNKGSGTWYTGGNSNHAYYLVLSNVTSTGFEWDNAADVGLATIGENAMTLVAGKRYRLQAKINRQSGSGSPQLYIRNTWDSGTTLHDLIWASGTNNTLIFTEFTCPDDDVTYALNFSAGGVTTGTISDISLHQVGEVAAYTPQSIGETRDNGTSGNGKKWYDTTTNSNDGTITGATKVGRTHIGRLDIGTGGGSSAYDLDVGETGKGKLNRIDFYDSNRYIERDSNDLTFYSHYSGFKFNAGSVSSGTRSGGVSLQVNADRSVTATSSSSANLKQVARGFTTTIVQPTGKAFTSFRLNHNLGTQFIHVSVIESGGTQEVVECAVRIGSWTEGQTGANISSAGTAVTGVTIMGTENTNAANKEEYCMVTFATAPAVGTNYKVVVMGV